jgi:hypothetical protein
MKSELVLIIMYIIQQNVMKHHEIQPCNNYYAGLEDGNLIEFDNECP